MNFKTHLTKINKIISALQSDDPFSTTLSSGGRSRVTEKHPAKPGGPSIFLINGKRKDA